jgi:AraC-like DNA-binding protein
MKRVTWRDAYGLINPHIDAAGVHVWPFDPSFPLTVQFWVYDRQSSIRMNHHDYFELIFVDSGEVLFQIQDSVLRLKPGDLLVMGSTLFHRLVYIGKRTKAPRIMFLPQLISPSGVAGVNSEYLMPFLVQDKHFPHVVPAETGLSHQIRGLLQRINDELTTKSTSGRLLARTYLMTILALLVRHYAPYQGSASVLEGRRRDLKRLQPVFDFIDSHYGYRFEIEEVAPLLSMSRRSFTRFFKKVTGQTFVAYLNGVRIEKALFLLASRNMSIAEVSQSVGFCNQSYFGLIFRRLTHVSARAYQEQLDRPSQGPTGGSH